MKALRIMYFIPQRIKGTNLVCDTVWVGHVTDSAIFVQRDWAETAKRPRL